MCDNNYVLSNYGCHILVNNCVSYLFQD